MTERPGRTPQTMVLFGDSLLGQMGKGLTSQVEQLAPGWLVLNCATGGFTARDGADRVAAVQRIAARQVILSFGLNDAAQSQLIPSGEFAELLRGIINALPPAKVAMLLPPQVIESRLAAGSARTCALVADYRNAGREACESTAATIIDGELLAARVRDAGADSHDLDGVHLSEALYGELVTEFVSLVG